MKKYIFIATVSIAVFGMTSCLKDKNLVLDPEKSPSVVEFSTIFDVPVGHGAGYTLFSRAFDITPADQTSNFEVNITGGNAASGDVTVQVDTNPDAIAAYNKENGTKYVMLPSSLYTLASSAVIKSGSRKAEIAATFKTSGFDLKQAYVLPLRVKSTTSGNVSGNFGTVLYAISAKNQYDGIYSLKGYILRAGDNVLSGQIKKGITRPLTTLTSNSVGFAQVWADGGGVAGIDGTTITIDPATNKVTMSASSNPALKNLASYDNRYDPATKTFYISFYWGTGPTNRAATDTLTYVGPR